MKMNGLKKAPRKKGDTVTAATDEAVNDGQVAGGVIAGQVAGGGFFFDEIEIKAKVFGPYNVDTESLVLRAGGLNNALKKVGLNFENINNSVVELKLYNNEHSLHGNIMKSRIIDDEIIDLTVKLEKSGKDTDDQIKQIIESQKEVEKDGEAYVTTIRIHLNNLPADAGKIKVKRGFLRAPAAADTVEDDQEIQQLNAILEKTSYRAYRDGQRNAMRVIHVLFSGVSVRADITSAGNVVVKIQERRGTLGNALDRVNKTFSSVYKATRDRDIINLLRKKVSAAQLIVDNNTVQYKSFEEVAEDAKELWEKYQPAAQPAAQFDGGADSAAPAYNVADSDRMRYALAKVKFQGFDTGKGGKIENLLYDDEKIELEITITKAEIDEGHINLFNNMPIRGGLKLTFVMEEPPFSVGQF
jgi:hypothetical protein